MERGSMRLDECYQVGNQQLRSLRERFREDQGPDIVLSLVECRGVSNRDRGVEHLWQL